MAKLTVEQVAEIVGAITYKPDWHIHLKDDGERMYIQIAATSLDSITHKPVPWSSGKTYLSPFMCRQEIVGAVFGAIEKAEIHEMREFFRYKGASIFNPHLDPDVLVEVARKKESFNLRDNAMSMTEEAQKVVDPRKDDFIVKASSGRIYKWHAAGRRLEGTSASWTYTVEEVRNFLDKGIWVVVE